MSLDLIAGPAVEPVTLADAKQHLRVDGTAEDAFIQTLIVTSRLHVEAALGLALITQQWTLRLDRWPDGLALELPLRPVTSVEAIRVLPATGAGIDVDPAACVLDGRANPARLVLSSPLPQPGAAALGIEIDFTAGFGAEASDVPAPIRHAILLLVAHWYENREPVAADARPVPIPAMVSELLAPFRAARL